MAISLGDLLRKEFTTEYFISRPLLPIGGMLLIAGPEKVGKSLLARHIAYQLASGLPLLDNDFWPVPHPQVVLSIEQEVGEYEEKERLGKIDASYQSMDAHINMWCVSKDLTITLDTNEGRQRLRREIESVNPTVLMLDPIREFSGAEENSSTEVRNVLHPLRNYLNNRERKVALIIVHHTSKPSEWRSSSNPNAARGSNYLAAAANSIIMVEPVPNRDNFVKLHFTCRSARKPYPMVLEFDEVTGRFRDHRRDVAS